MVTAFRNLFLITTLTASFAAAQAADIYKIDPAASTVSWKAYKKIGDSHHGQIKLKDGEISLDKDGKLTDGKFSVDMATISNEDLKDKAEYQKKLVDHLSSNDFFNVSKFPEATFKIKKITAATKTSAKISGDLTFIGQTHAVEFPAKISTDKGTVTGEGKLKIDRTKWGLKYGSGNFFKELTADKIIKDEFELDLKLIAKK
jgi:polyisoprenoid-binding protein YceI